jgi:hypothetical protein
MGLGANALTDWRLHRDPVHVKAHARSTTADGALTRANTIWITVLIDRQVQGFGLRVDLLEPLDDRLREACGS